jgi:hypothetical protein
MEGACFGERLFTVLAFRGSPDIGLFPKFDTMAVKLKWSISDHTYAKQQLYRRAYAARCCGGDDPALAVWHALEAHSSPETRQGTLTKPDRDFDAEQSESTRTDSPGNNPDDGSGK